MVLKSAQQLSHLKHYGPVQYSMYPTEASDLVFVGCIFMCVLVSISQVWYGKQKKSRTFPEFPKSNDCVFLFIAWNVVHFYDAQPEMILSIVCLSHMTVSLFVDGDIY